MYLLETAASTASSSSTLSAYTPFIMIVVLFVIMYFFSIRPQRKKDKEIRDMRSNIEVGDGVTTIGGIVGRVISVNDETIVIATGADRTKIRFQKWAIQEVEKIKLDE